MASAKAKHSRPSKTKQVSPKGKNRKRKAVSSNSKLETSESEAEPKRTSKKKPPGPSKSKRACRNTIDEVVHESKASEEEEIEPFVEDAEDEEVIATRFIVICVLDVSSTSPDSRRAMACRNSTTLLYPMC
jgi:hypothetical protein